MRVERRFVTGVTIPRQLRIAQPIYEMARVNRERDAA
jgi:hypothetical protein